MSNEEEIKPATDKTVFDPKNPEALRPQPLYDEKAQVPTSIVMPDGLTAMRVWEQEQQQNQK